METTKPTLTFFDLPAEIRNEIYIHHLCSNSPIELPYAYESRHFVEPALLATHPSIRSEAAPIYYGCNTFETPSPASAHCFLSQLSPECISWIRSFRPLDLTLPTSAHVRWLEAMRANLNKLVGVGKGVLVPEAISVPLKRGDGSVVWYRLDEIDDFEIVRGEGGAWRLEWRDRTLP